MLSFGGSIMAQLYMCLLFIIMILICIGTGQGFVASPKGGEVKPYQTCSVVVQGVNGGSCDGSGHCLELKLCQQPRTWVGLRGGAASKNQGGREVQREENRGGEKMEENVSAQKPEGRVHGQLGEEKEDQEVEGESVEEEGMEVEESGSEIADGAEVVKQAKEEQGNATRQVLVEERISWLRAEEEKVAEYKRVLRSRSTAPTFRPRSQLVEDSRPMPSVPAQLHVDSVGTPLKDKQQPTDCLHGAPAAGLTICPTCGQPVGPQPKYIVIKALLFLYYMSLGSVMPYLPVYYHSLGIDDGIIGRLGAITPAVTFLVSPLWGIVADKTGRLKEVLIFAFVTSVCLRVALVAHNTMGWIVMMITLTAVVNAPVRPLLDSSVLNLLQDKKQYGKQRLWGQVGFGVGSFVVGPALSRSTLGYKAAFIAHGALSVPTVLLLLKFKPKKTIREPARFWDGIKVLSRDKGATVFFCLVFAIGLSSGVIENFAYKRLKEIGGDGNTLGVSRLVSAISGIPMFYYSGHLPKMLSVMSVLILSLVSYIVRFLIYASVTNAWYAMPAEILRGATFAAFWAACTYHSHRIAPAGLSTTMLGIQNAVYGGLGQSIGALVGGSLCVSMGTAGCFYASAAFDTVLLGFALIYWAIDPRATDLKPEKEA